VDSMPAIANILIVDDDERNLVAMQELLQGLGHNLVLASSGEQALRHVLQDDFAVILLDARMPVVDGFTTAKLIRGRERSRHTPIIFITGAHEDLESMFRGYAAGAVDYMVKPLISEVLKYKISVFVELYHKNAALTREIAERKLAEEQLRQSEEKLRALAVHLQSVREEERTRIAREVHDELGQALTGLKMDLGSLINSVPKSCASLLQKARSMSRLIDTTIRSVRRIASGLRPGVLDEIGLAAAIGWQAKDFQMRAGIRCRVKVPVNGVELDAQRSTAAFRIFQEVLTNVARHANATRVDVVMERNSTGLKLKIADNGRGISQHDICNPKSLGLLGMRERALLFGGNVDIAGMRGKGTKVTVSIPGSQS
jgi:signal transduction histidine kinase